MILSFAKTLSASKSVQYRRVYWISYALAEVLAPKKSVRAEYYGVALQNAHLAVVRLTARRAFTYGTEKLPFAAKSSANSIWRIGFISLEEVELSQEYLLVLENLPGFFVDAI